MNFVNNAGPLTFTLPFQLPFDLPFATKDKLSSTTTVTIDKENFQFFLRLTVIICTYLLFRPHLERLFRTVLGREDPTAVQIQERLNKIDSEKKDGKKVYAVVGGKGDAKTPTKEKESPAGTASSGKGSRRRKA